MLDSVNKNNFRMLFDHDKIPMIDAILEVNTPSVNHSFVTIPLGSGINTKKAGDELTFGSLELSVMADKYLYNWEQFYAWMLQRKGLMDGTLFDKRIVGTFQMLAENGFVNREIEYSNIFPTDISDIQFVTNDQDSTMPVFSITLEFDYMKIIPLDKKILDKIKH